MKNSTILVTGSTGKTGSYVVKHPIQKGFAVRAFVHRVDERSERLEALGAKIFAGDFRDLQSVRSAMQGVKRVYFCPAAQTRTLR